MVDYLNRLGKRMSSRGFPADDPALVLVINALKAMYELHTEMQCRSIDGRGREEKPPVDPVFTRTSAPRRHEKYRLVRPRTESHYASLRFASYIYCFRSPYGNLSINSRICCFTPSGSLRSWGMWKASSG
jgi:hypothetical protein